jgi:hypothetical protein
MHTPAMCDRLDGDSSFDKIDANADVIGLLTLIQTHTAAKHGNQDPSHILMNAHIDFYTFRQGSLSLSDYHAGFKDRVDVLERLQGPVGQDSDKVVLYAIENDVDESVAKEACRQQFLATNFILHSNPKTYGAMMDEMQYDRVRCGLEYPQTLMDAHATLSSYIQPRRTQ